MNVENLKNEVFKILGAALVEGMKPEMSVNTILDIVEDFAILTDWKVEGDDYFDGLGLAEKLRKARANS